jgi:site-specific DNA-adenine methylase
MYLDLRARGFDGPAVLADSHPQVSSFWRLIHGDPDALLSRMDDLGRTPATAERYYSMLCERSPDPVEVTARFLWLTNYAFGNAPNVYRDGWSHTTGTKLTSAAKWGKTFPWADCVERARLAAAALDGAPVAVFDDAADALALTTDASHTYADPPYWQERAYSGSEHRDYIALVESASGLIVLSESAKVAHRLAEWDMDEAEIVARMTGGEGAGGKRGEVVYVRAAVDEEAAA